MAEQPSEADVAQLVEQLICNQQVAGSSPIVSSTRCALKGLLVAGPLAASSALSSVAYRRAYTFISADSLTEAPEASSAPFQLFLVTIQFPITIGEDNHS